MKSKDIELSRENGYSNAVFNWLIDMEVGTEIEIGKFIPSNEMHYFLDVIKWYIEVHRDVEFSGDYSKLRKTKPFKY